MDKTYTPYVERVLKPQPHLKRPSFEFYAAHFLCGSGLTCGDLDAHVRSLAREFETHYRAGTEDAAATLEACGEIPMVEKR